MSDPDFIRVTDEVKPTREYSIVRSSFDPKVHTRLDKPGAALDGTILPPKYTPEALSSKSGDAAPSGQKADSSKENSR